MKAGRSRCSARRSSWLYAGRYVLHADLYRRLLTWIGVCALQMRPEVAQWFYDEVIETLAAILPNGKPPPARQPSSTNEYPPLQTEKPCEVHWTRFLWRWTSWVLSQARSSIYALGITCNADDTVMSRPSLRL